MAEERCMPTLRKRLHELRACECFAVCIVGRVVVVWKYIFGVRQGTEPLKGSADSGVQHRHIAGVSPQMFRGCPLSVVTP